jgi:hypothetical protein|tara:strand:+ start:495 stop:629 length:135 start_codon:yes stop_codon:yes gene_type:complete
MLSISDILENKGGDFLRLILLFKKVGVRVEMGINKTKKYLRNRN